MRPMPLFGAVCAVVAVGTCAFAVHAADLGPAFPAPPAYAEPDAQFEFGTGWYLRGDVSTGEDDHPALTAAGFDTRKQDWNYVLGGGVGYKFNNFLRVDVTGDYFAPNNYRDEAVVDGVTLANQAKVQKFDGLANLYIDLGDWYGVTPYVGGGAGFAVFDPSEHVRFDTGVADNTGSRTNFAWAAMAGVSWQIDPNIALDVGYRHVDLGSFSTTLIGYRIDHHYTEDQVRVGLRYMIF